MKNQLGNGGIAMTRGTHSSQVNLAPLPTGVDRSELRTGSKPVIMHTFEVAGRSVEVTFDGLQREDGSRTFEVDFTVDGNFRTVGTSSAENNSEIASKIGQIFRSEVGRQKSGTEFSGFATKGDGLGPFREAMYARTGMSFGGGSVTAIGTAGERQSGIKSGGKLVPSHSDGRLFNKDELKAHKASVRTALKDSIRAGRKARQRQTDIVAGDRQRASELGMSLEDFNMARALGEVS